MKIGLEEACWQGSEGPLSDLVSVLSPFSVSSLLHPLQDPVVNLLGNEKGHPGLWTQFSHFISSEKIVDNSSLSPSLLKTDTRVLYSTDFIKQVSIYTK